MSEGLKVLIFLLLIMWFAMDAYSLIIFVGGCIMIPFWLWLLYTMFFNREK